MGDDQLGLESSPEKYVASMVDVFRAVKRVLKDDGTLWLNLGDSYCGTGHKGDHKDPKHKEGRNSQAHAINNKVEGLKSKDLVGIPWRVAFALQADGWYLRQDIIWHKPNPMPESVKDRCTKSHEYIFLMSKSPKYYYDADAVSVHTDSGTSNKRDVWTVNIQPYKDAHFATFPRKLIEPCILAGSKAGDTILDPFTGSGTTGLVSVENGRHFLGVELNPDYKKLAEQRINSAQPMLWN
jgi:DNA modification methylase